MCAWVCMNPIRAVRVATDKFHAASTTGHSQAVPDGLLSHNRRFIQISCHSGFGLNRIMDRFDECILLLDDIAVKCPPLKIRSKMIIYD